MLFWEDTIALLVCLKLIRLQRIHKFWLFHAVILSFLDVLQSFYSHFISFLVLTYWHSAKCQLLFSACFLHRRKSIPNGVQTQRNFLWICLDQKTSSGPDKRLGVLRGENNPPEDAWSPRRALVGCAHLGCTRTTSLLYKYPNIPETLGESTKIDSSRRRVQNHQIQSRHHLGWGLPPPLVPLRWCVSSSL